MPPSPHDAVLEVHDSGCLDHADLLELQVGAEAGEQPGWELNY